MENEVYFMYSMTGYGFTEEVYEDFQVSVELRSLNNKYLDINIRIPYHLGFFEPKIKNIIKNYVKRGKIDVSINLQETIHNFKIIPDLALADAYYDAFRQVIKHFKGKIGDKVNLNHIILSNGVINVDKGVNIEKFWQGIEKALSSSINQLNENKKMEGDSTKKDLEEIIEYLDGNLNKISNYSIESITKYEQKLKNKIKDLLENKQIGEDRILQEVAIMSTKIDINEEVSRLFSHINLFREAIKEENDSVGRKLEFISQEMSREMNTISSKANHSEISTLIIDMKIKLEQIKEQIRNIE